MTSKSLSAREAIVHELSVVTDAFRVASEQVDDRLDEEAVHEARVALRRLRSILRTFAALFDRGFASTVRTDLQWFANQLGALRDADVTLTYLDTYFTQHSLPGASSLLTFVRAEQQTARENLRKA